MKRISLALLISLVLNPSIAFSLSVDGNDTEDIYSGDADITHVDAYDSSTLNIYGGDIAWLYAYDNSTMNIDGGDVSWLYANNNSQVNITYIDDLSWLLVNDDSQVNIFGSNFSYSSGHLSGIWSNGVSFSFWALEETDLQGGSIGNIMPDNIRLNAVPIPAAVWLFGSGLAGLGFLRRKKS
jgi:hypothetical protein